MKDKIFKGEELRDEMEEIFLNSKINKIFK